MLNPMHTLAMDMVMVSMVITTIIIMDTLDNITTLGITHTTLTSTSRDQWMMKQLLRAPQLIKGQQNHIGVDTIHNSTINLINTFLPSILDMELANVVLKQN